MITIPVKIRYKNREEFQPLCTKPPSRINNQNIPRNLFPLIFIAMMLWLVVLIPYGKNSSLLGITSGTPPEHSSLIHSRCFVDDFIQTTEGGFAFAINAKQRFSYTETEPLSFPETILLKTDEEGNIQWSKPIGGIISEASGRVTKLIQTMDKGFALVGYTQSCEIGNGDGFLAKTDSKGRLLWNRTYGGLGNDRLERLFQTSDGGYILAGTTNSFGVGDNDIWMVKTDHNGGIEWSNTYETSEGYHEEVSGFIQTNDDGFALVGHRIAPDTHRAVPFLLKTSGTGNKELIRSFEDIFQDNYAPFCLLQTAEGKFVIAGYQNTYPEPGCQTGNGFILITSTNGILEQKIDYSSHYGYFTEILQTSDGGFALTGFDAGTWNEEWKSGLLLMKVYQNGTIQWQRVFSSNYFANNEYSNIKLVHTTNDRFALACTARWEAHTVTWLVLTDSEGAIVGNRVYSGAMCDEMCKDLIQTIDGGYALVGYTNSNKTGTTDMILVKTMDNGTEEWIKMYDKYGDDKADVLVQTSDGGFAVAGSTTHRQFPWRRTPWLVRTDEKGIMEWDKTFEELGDFSGSISHLFQTSDGGFILANDEWPGHLVKTNTQGQIEWTYPTNKTGITDVVLTEKEEIVLVEAGWSSADHPSLSQYESTNGIYNISLVKINKMGIIQWKRTYIVKDDDVDLACALIETSDNGLALVVSGQAERVDPSYPIHVLNYSTFLLRMDEFGLEMWNQTVGEVFWEENYLNFIQMTDGSFYLTGLTRPLGKNYPNWGTGSDYFFQSIILDENGIIEDFTNLSYIKEDIKVIIPTLDGGFAFGGSIHSYNEENGFSFDISIKKTDENRTVLWSHTYGQSGGQLSSWTVEINTFSILDTKTTMNATTSFNATMSFNMGIYLLPATLILLRQRKRKKRSE